MKIASRLFLFTLIASLSSCSSHRTLDRASHEYACSHLEKAEEIIEDNLTKSKAEQHWQNNKNSALYLLYGAYFKHFQGDYNLAIKRYQKALEAIDFYSQESGLEKSQMLALDDNQAAFSGDFYERLLARFYFALCLQQAGESDNSQALLRQYEETSQLIQEEMRSASFLSHVQISHNLLARYLLACGLEARSDLSNARILLESCKQGSIHEAFFNKELNSLGKRSKKAWLVVVVHLGQVPQKTQGFAAGATASLLALEAYLDSRQIDPAWSSMTGIAIPEYKDQFNTHFPLPPFKLDSKNITSLKMVDVSEIARQELNQKLPVITARALARQLMRRAIVYHQYTKSESAGVTADLLLLWANINTKADTRSWSLLPSEIWLARRDLEPGTHTFQVADNEPLELTLKTGLNLVEVFAPSETWVLFGSKKWGPFPSKILQEHLNNLTPSH